MTTKDLTVRLTSAALLTGIAMASVACTGSGTRESEVDRTEVTEIAESKDVKPAVADNMVYDEKSNGCFETWTGGEAYGFRTVTFGKYRGEDLEWLILDENESGLLLLTKKAVEARPYHDEYVPVTWEECSLRKWLNNEFYNTAFSQEEKNSIIETTVVTGGSMLNNITGGNDTRDNVFLLSADEAVRFFDMNGDRRAEPCDYLGREEVAVSLEGYVYWWLRTPGGDPMSEYAETKSDDAAVIGTRGVIGSHGERVSETDICVRPAVWVDKSSAPAERGFEVIGEPAGDVSYYPEDSADEYGYKTVRFGNIRGENIEWLVLDETDDALLLISRYVYGGRPYNDDLEATSWEDCTLRKWLNDGFYNCAFSDSEKARIRKTVVENEGCSDTEDNVFILSVSEVERYFDPKEAVGARPVDDKDSKYSCSWWLRTPGSGSELTAFVSSFGKIHDSGAYVCYYDQGFRPAVWISK